MSSTSSVAICRCSRPFIWIRFSVAISEITRSTCGISTSDVAVATAAGVQLGHAQRPQLGHQRVGCHQLRTSPPPLRAALRRGVAAVAAWSLRMARVRRPKIGGARCIVRSLARQIRNAGGPRRGKARSISGGRSRLKRRRPGLLRDAAASPLRSVEQADEGGQRRELGDRTAEAVALGRDRVAHRGRVLHLARQVRDGDVDLGLQRLLDLAPAECPALSHAVQHQHRLACLRRSRRQRQQPQRVTHAGQGRFQHQDALLRQI